MNKLVKEIDNQFALYIIAVYKGKLPLPTIQFEELKKAFGAGMLSSIVTAVKLIEETKDADDGARVFGDLIESIEQWTHMSLVDMLKIAMIKPIPRPIAIIKPGAGPN